MAQLGPVGHVCCMVAYAESGHAAGSAPSYFMSTRPLGLGAPAKAECRSGFLLYWIRSWRFGAPVRCGKSRPGMAVLGRGALEDSRSR